MAQDQTKKDESFDLVAEFRRLAATADFDQPVPPPPVSATKRPPPLPPGLPPVLPLEGSAAAALPGLETGGAGARPKTGAGLPPALPLGSPDQSAQPLSGPLPPLVQPRPPGKAVRKSEPRPDGAEPQTGQPHGPSPGAVASSPDGSAKKAERRAAKRRAAAPSRDQIAANDDAPSIGGLIYALNQKPSRRPYGIAAGASAAWAFITLGFTGYFWGNEIISGAGLAAFLGRPEFLTTVATLAGPIGLMFALAVIFYRAEEMRLRSSAMTEVAVRLAEPDRMAEQSVASLGQAVRRQVSFMNDAVSRAIGRAGELEAMVHNEVTSLERSYEENERRIRSLIQELAGERNALVVTGDRMSGTFKSIGTEVPELIEKLSAQQIKLARIIEGASVNLTSLETAIATQTGNFEATVVDRTLQLQTVLGEYTGALSSSLDTNMEQIGTTIASRTGDLQVVFEEYTRALDTTLGNRAIEIDQRLGDHVTAFLDRTQALDVHLVERTQALDQAFTDRLRLFDDAILRSTSAIDQSVGEKTVALTSALDRHATSLGETLTRQSLDLDESLLQGINAVRRTSENITRQSIKALEGLAGQSELLKSVSENLLGQINTITNRFDGQSQQIIRAANALETANYKIDKTLQSRHEDLSLTLDRLSGKAEELGTAAQGYSRQIEGTITDAEKRARVLTSELAQQTEERSRATIADIERLRSVATDTTNHALDDLRSRFSHVSQEVTQGFNSLNTQLAESTGDARRRTAQAASELAAEQDRLRTQTQALPSTTRESADAMRRVLHDHLRAIDQLSTLSQREAIARDVSRPTASQHGDMTGPPPARQLIPIPGPQPPREPPTQALTSLGAALSQELQSRTRAPAGAAAYSQGTALPAGQSAALGQQQGQPQPDARDGWSLGDLLKRASADDDSSHHARQRQAPPAPRSGLDFAAVARAIDPTTATAIWQRLGTGQRGIMVRSIYAPEGRLLFDDTVARLSSEPGFAETTHKYLADFERVLQEAERQDPSGQAAQGHLRSEYGRAYLFLAHATGRIT